MYKCRGMSSILALPCMTLMCTCLLTVSTQLDTQTTFSSENLIPVLSYLPINSPSHLCKAHTTHIPPRTHTHTHTYTQTYGPFFLGCVCTRLPGRKSFSGMDECLQLIHHPPYPPPSPLFLYQPAVTLTTDGPLSLLLPFFLFSLTSLSWAISLFSRSPVPYLLCLFTCMFVGIHAHFLTS